MKKGILKTALLDTVPVLTGYVVLGIGFGILLSQAGYGVGISALMAVLIYAGSAQYLLVSLMTSGASLLSTALAVLVVNARHLFYGISMVDSYRSAGKKKPYLIFGLTDETYSLVTRPIPFQGPDRHRYYLLVTALDHGYWICGCVLGSLAGRLLPLDFTGVSFVLTALFVTIFVEQWLSTKEHGPALVGVLATAGCLLLFGTELFLIPSMAAIAGLLLLGRKTGRSVSHGE